MLAILAFVVGRRFYRVPFDWSRFAKVLVAAGAALFIGFEIAGSAVVLWQKILLQVVGIVVYPVVLLLVGFVSRDQLHQGLQGTILKLREKVGA